MRLTRSRSLILLTAIVCLAIPCVTAANADTVVTLPSSTDATHSFDGLRFDTTDYLDDPTGAYTIDDVASAKLRSAFSRFPTARRRDRVIRGWFRFRIVGGEHRLEEWALGANADCDVVDLYAQGPDGRFEVSRFGMLVPLARRRVPEVPWPLLPLDARMLDGRTLYLYVVADRFVVERSALFRLDAVGGEAADAAALALTDQFFAGLFFAALTLNIFLWLYLRDRTFLVYVVAMALHIVTQLAEDDEAWRWFWPHASIPALPLTTVARIAFFVALPFFWRQFLDLPRRYPRVDRVLLASVAVSSIYGLLSVFVPQRVLPDFPVYPVIFLSMGVALYAAIRAMRDGFRPARFLIVAISGLFVFWTITSAKVLLHVPIPFDVHFGLYAGTSWDALVLTFALADKLQTANRERIAEQIASLARLEERDAAMSRFLPREFLLQLGRENVVDLQLGDHVQCEMTVLFSDIRSFTALSEALSPEETFRLLNGYLQRAGPVIRENEGFVDKYIGDAIMGLFPAAASTAIDAAIGLHARLEDFNRERALHGNAPIAIGVGLHRGLLTLGAIGESLRIETTVIADSVNIASRIETLTKTCGASIVASEAVVDALADRDRYRLRPLGAFAIRGATRKIRMYEVFDADAQSLIAAKIATLAAFREGVEAFDRADYAIACDRFEGVLARSPLDAVATYFERQSRGLLEARESSA